MTDRNLSLILLLSSLVFSSQLSARTYTFYKDKNLRGLAQKSHQIINEKNGDLSVAFSFSSMDVSSKNTRVPFEFEDLIIKGLDNTHQVGKPSLPFTSILLEGHPEDFSLSVIAGEEFLVNDVLPSPAQKMPCRCDKKEEDIPFTYDVKGYQRLNKFITSVKYLGKYRGVALTKVTITPLKYSDENYLSVHPKLKVKFHREAGTVELFNANSISQNKKYLIIAPSEYHQDLQTLIKQKKSQGFDVILKTQNIMGKDFLSIKSSIHKLYQKIKFSYALLVGHEESFPTEFVETSNSNKTPSDLGYFLMDGVTDKVPDVFYGRMNVSSSSNVQNQIAKILEYENKSWSDASGFSKMIGIASDEGYNPSDVEYTEQFAKPLKDDLNKTIDYFLQESTSSTSANLVKRMNKGSYWINYIGHGSGTSWPSINTGEFTVNDIKGLTPGHVKPVLIDVACQNGRFSNQGRLGERFMNETNQGLPVGAVAYFGGSVDISWHPPAIMAKGINKELASIRPETIGEVLLAGQLYLLENYDDLAAAEENLVWYHLQGDPTLQLQY
jgi:hypothetical protein